MVVQRDEHRIEIQIRTKNQQAWANVVEKIAARHQLPLKDEIGPSEILDWLQLVSEKLSLRDLGLSIPTELNESVEDAMEMALLWMNEAANK